MRADAELIRQLRSVLDDAASLPMMGTRLDTALHDLHDQQQLVAVLTDELADARAELERRA
jgi:hypothetical protein